ncbi:TPA: D-amino-acid transaminase [Providencia stuartii]|uniref:D-amino-acid transaminase n=1 Tax=Providencia TaxID=586 RepID=UPI00090A6937|nr:MULTISPECIES: D-amino-acid transaminase [Providencia]APG50397.1 D-amino acid aminotransferase [Providencia stuartii]AVL39876.1 D-amino-acid transaminase [Providencia stuartii]MBG5902635.1 D-amino-acid transaminase [Providencia stuartii]MBG5910386.1 D-amino-acid transaminase [Providencia stuartii]MBG5914208.1 D-amino-acid transaminase [Providencia stuartii]
MMTYINGRFIPEEQASISIFDRGFLFADAVYEVTAVINGKLIDFKNHIARLKRSCHELELALPYTEDVLFDIHRQLIEKNNLTEGLIYLQLTRGNAGQRNFLFPDKTIPPTLVLFAQQASIIENPRVKTGIRVVTFEDIRWQRCDIKTVALLAACLAKEYARSQGVEDALFVKDGFITEGSSSNFFIITAENKIKTRSLSHEILPGITRQAILTLAQEQNLAVEESSFTIEEAITAKEAFITSSTTLVWPVIEIDGQKIAGGKPGQLALRLRDIYIQKMLAI